NAGGPNTSACHQYDNDPNSCLAAFHQGQTGISSCYYDGFGQECIGCGPNNQQSGSCINTCLYGTASCAQDPSRTVFVGGPGSTACHAFDGDQGSCALAFHRDSDSRSASCYYDSD